VARWRRLEPTRYGTLMKRLTMHAEAGLAAARDDDAAGFLGTVASYATALAELGRAGGVDIVTREHVKIAEAAAASGVVYKTCGAGGGDIGIAFATDPDRLTDFGRRLDVAGFQMLALARDSRGLCAE
jgi:phosphomevalonate kinase